MNKNTQTIQLSGSNLTIDQIYSYASGTAADFQFEMDAKAHQKLKKSREFVLEVVRIGKPVYGINTGFGVLSDQFIQQKDLAELQVNLIRSHCTGVGKPFSIHITRSIHLILANSLLKGYSGIAPEIVELILAFLNHDMAPVIPEKGSVGASGDLAPLSHLAHCLIGEGDVIFENKIQPAHSVLKKLGLKPVSLGPKDGLALINGTHVMCALACKAVYEAKQLIKAADLVCAMSLEGVRGSVVAFDEDLHNLKAHKGQVESAQNVRALLKNSPILKSHENCNRVQDAYSFRCAAQVHGASRQAIDHTEMVVSQELQSVTDNPIVFADQKRVVSGGHFHGEALAMAMDYLSIGVAEICSISERRVVKMVNPEFSQLPVFLTKNSGLHSGLMIVQYTSAALVSENKVLAHPASVDSVSTNNDKEDHVSMGLTSGRKLQEIVFNATQCLAIEFLCATQAIHLLRPLQSSKTIEKVISKIRETVPPISDDRYFAKDIESIAALVQSGEILKACDIELV